MDNASENIDLSIFNGYPADVLSKVRSLIKSKKLTSYLNNKYPEQHSITTDKTLFKYVQDIKKYYMKNAEPIHNVSFDNNIERIFNALGINYSKSIKHGRKLKSKNQIKISSIFKKAPEAFLRMIVVHEVAHLKVKDHNKEFYKLCVNMEPDYFQLEFDLRLYLFTLDNI